MRRSCLSRLLAGTLALWLLLSCLPVQAVAAELPGSWERWLLEQVLQWYRQEGELPRNWQDLFSRWTSPGETVPEETLPAAEAELTAEAEPEYNLYFGQLHAHTDLSDGTGTVEETFQYASTVPGLDFFAVTDHSDSFDNELEGSLDVEGSAVSTDWAAGKAAAAAVTGGDFVGLFGFEISWPRIYQLGHIGTFGTAGFLSWQQEGYDTYDGSLQRYYAALAESGGIGQFNHPGTQNGTFLEFEGHTPEADRAMTLLEAAGEEGFHYYVKALDRGWHLAPTFNQTPHDSRWIDTGARTAVFAASLTEEGIYDALRNYRVYATEDADLDIRYALNGYFMGSQSLLADMGETLELTVTLSDPTDAAIGTVEVMGSGGASLKSQYLAEPGGSLSFSLPAAPGYYFLRVTQPDGDVALTAPVWVEDGPSELAITAFACTTELPVQNEPVALTLEITNGRREDFQIQALEILADGYPVSADTSLTVIPGRSTVTHDTSFFSDSVGMTEITLRITGTVGEERCTLEESLMLSFQQSAMITAIGVDGSHGNAGLDSLTLLTRQAMEENIDVAVLTQEAVVSQLERYRFFLIPAPTEPFSEDFCKAISEFLSFGGSLVVCGQGDDPTGTAELNRLLAYVGSGLRINADLVTDEVNNGGSPEEIYTDGINFDSDWCAGVSENQVYRQVSGASVTGGTWLVKGRPTTMSSDGTAEPVLLAAEENNGSGTVFAAGTLFCQDGSMEEPRNIWDEPYANYTITHKLLSIGGEAVALSTIRQARQGAQNQLFRIRGYVTAGTSNAYNTFPETIYVQDDTGGIAVMPYTGEAIQQGTAVEITGYAGQSGGNRILKPSRWKPLDADGYVYEPLEGDWSTLLDTGTNGGMLVQVEGTCLEVYAREDGTLAGCLLQDKQNLLARIRIEDYIGNGSDGGNDLHKTIRKGRTVRAMGLLHIDEYGDTVLRVRNCEEVVWVPPLHLEVTNPKTGDPVFLPVVPMAVSLAALLLLRKRPYRGKYQKLR